MSPADSVLPRPLQSASRAELVSHCPSRGLPCCLNPVCQSEAALSLALHRMVRLLMAPFLNVVLVIDVTYCQLASSAPDAIKAHGTVVAAKPVHEIAASGIKEGLNSDAAAPCCSYCTSGGSCGLGVMVRRL